MYATSRARIRKALCGLIGGGIAISLLFACNPAQPSQSPSLTPSPVITDQPTPPAGSITTPEEAIAAIKARFTAVSNIVTAEPQAIGAAQDIYVIPREGGWNIIFWEGSGDCAAGCLNDHYWYFAVESNGQIAQVGEFERVFDSRSNDYIKRGTPLWGIPY